MLDEDPMKGLLTGECVYQVASGDLVRGTRAYPKPVSAEQLLKSFGIIATNNHESGQDLPCGSVVYVDEDSGHVTLSRISGAQLIALGKKISINSSSKEDLEAIPGIGPKMAERIIAFRESNGHFSSLRDLEKVSGIGPKKYQELEPYLSL